MSVLRTFDSNEGRRVTLEKIGDRLVIRRAITSEGRGDPDLSIADTMEHWGYVRRELAARAPHLLDAGDLYPAVDDASLNEDHMVMEYLDGGTLNDLDTVDDATALATVATRRLLVVVDALGYASSGPSTGRFATDELGRRLVRLQVALDQLPAAQRRALKMAEELVDRSAEFLAVRRAASTDLPHIHIAVHGDFGLNNVVLESGPARGERVVFIDTRARWVALGRGGSATRVPVWDVAFDLGAFYIFATEIQPLLLEGFGFGSPSPLLGRHATLARILEEAADAAGLPAREPDWRARVEVACAVRLVGSVGAQLVSATSQRVERAASVAACAHDYLRREHPIPWAA